MVRVAKLAKKGANKSAAGLKGNGDMELEGANSETPSRNCEKEEIRGSNYNLKSWNSPGVRKSQTLWSESLNHPVENLEEPKDCPEVRYDVSMAATKNMSNNEIHQFIENEFGDHRSCRDSQEPSYSLSVRMMSPGQNAQRGKAVSGPLSRKPFLLRGGSRIKKTAFNLYKKYYILSFICMKSCDVSNPVLCGLLNFLCFTLRRSTSWHKSLFLVASRIQWKDGLWLAGHEPHAGSKESRLPDRTYFWNCDA